jgi:NTP pyrophosphatase (non-canonical NTP hydrolase)
MRDQRKERAAHIVYAAMQSLSTEGQHKPWVEGGNSTAQDTARRAADAIAEALATDLNALAREVNVINRANGWAVLKPSEWSDTYKVPAVLALIHSEVSEALEGFRKDDAENFAEELADVLIRVLDCAGGLGIDIESQVRMKLEKNATRGHKHGGKRV